MRTGAKMSPVFSRSSTHRTRMRRLRRTAGIRDLVAEHRLGCSDLIQPVFVMDGKGEQAVESMAGIHRLGIDALCHTAERAMNAGLPAIALFPVVESSAKSPNGEEAYRDDGLVQRAIRAVKEAAPDLAVISDVALDPYSIDGHDGIVQDGVILNDESVEVLQLMAIAQAEAGFDILGPSDMMDGRVGAIRSVLDKNGFSNTSIMSY